MEKDILDILPKISGEYRSFFNLSTHSWFKVGGKARILFKPYDIADLSQFIKNKPYNLECEILGACSNVIIRDGGFDGVIIKLGRNFTNISINNNLVKVGCGALDYHVAKYVADKSLAGLEFLIGIPGSIGGAVAMNAGCYGSEIADYLQMVEAVNRYSGEIVTLPVKDLSMTYRHNALSKDYFFINAVFQLEKGEKQQIFDKMKFISEQRGLAQPISSRTGGSTFKNPSNSPYKAWELIDKAGLRGKKIGGAQISEKHCNFLLNLGNATSDDLERLGELVCKNVYENSKIMLEWEIKILGDKEDVKN